MWMKLMEIDRVLDRGMDHDPALTYRWWHMLNMIGIGDLEQLVINEHILEGGHFRGRLVTFAPIACFIHLHTIRSRMPLEWNVVVSGNTKISQEYVSACVSSSTASPMHQDVLTTSGLYYCCGWQFWPWRLDATKCIFTAATLATPCHSRGKENMTK